MCCSSISVSNVGSLYVFKTHICIMKRADNSEKKKTSQNGVGILPRDFNGMIRNTVGEFMCGIILDLDSGKGKGKVHVVTGREGPEGE